MSRLLQLLVFMVALVPVAVHATETLRLNQLNTVTFRGEVDDASMSMLQVELTIAVAKRGLQTYPIYLVIDSSGGSIDAGLSFIQFAKMLPNIRTVSIFSASMASAIVEALPGERLITENGILMFHRAKGAVRGQFEEGELEQKLALYKTIVKSMEQTSANRIGISLADYKAKVKDEWWMYGQQAVDLKAADKVVNIVCSIRLIATPVASTTEGFFGSSTAIYSACPLFRSPLKSTTEDKKTVKFK